MVRVSDDRASGGVTGRRAKDKGVQAKHPVSDPLALSPSQGGAAGPATGSGRAETDAGTFACAQDKGRNAGHADTGFAVRHRSFVPFAPASTGRHALHLWLAEAQVHAGLYRRLIGAQIRSQMQYKVSFVLRMLGSFAGNLIDFGAIAVLFNRIPALAGWSLPEVALLYGLSAVAFSIAELFAAALDNFAEYVESGSFDRVLTRPIGALFQVITEDFALRRLGRLSQGVLVFVVALGLLDVDWTWDKGLIMAVAIGSGAVIFFSIFVLGAAYCFWTIQGREAANIFTYGGDFMSSYPLDIYHGWLRRFVTFVLPLAFISYYPALYVLGRPDPLGLPGWVRLLSPLAALGMALLAWAGWTIGVRHYQSTGS
ncbi:MAG: ABC-2 family transporter protein [Chloroflexi bacterium]|nr:ABC-2 family transporter protein [Chloroflexota bacterium]